MVLAVAPSPAEQIKLAWDANTEPNLAGYRVYYGAAPGQFSNSIDVGLATNATVNGLNPNAIFHFAVSAYNADGLESELSESIAYQTARAFSRQTFAGLIGDGSVELSGSFSATISPNRNVTGRIVLNGRAYAWRGTFDRDGSLVVPIPRDGQIASLTLVLALDGRSLTGTVATSNGVVELLGHAASTASVCAAKGSYTMVLSTEDSSLGGGYGFGTINVSKQGRARIVGTLPAGARFSAGLSLDSAETAPLYVFQHPKRRTIMGRVIFRDVPEESDADGVLRSHDPVGTQVVNLQAARYPVSSVPLAAVAYAAPNLSVEVTGISGGPLSGQLSAGRPMVARLPSGDLLSVKVSARTGLFSGMCSNAGKPRFTYAGAMYRKSAPQGYGRVQSERGSVELRENIP